MKIGDASGVSTFEAVPSTMYIVSFLTFCSLASPASVATRLDACLMYGTSAFGGRGPSYTVCADPAQSAAKRSGASCRNIALIVHPQAERSPRQPPMLAA